MDRFELKGAIFLKCMKINVPLWTHGTKEFIEMFHEFNPNEQVNICFSNDSVFSTCYDTKITKIAYIWLHAYIFDHLLYIDP